ncbi:MAG: hypothetical protein E4G94_02290 [ANME-2 cluster archaeon]|nr:MAG: hypothetical protein E4G94_02290 [ANME-2 cluster archaeon]
MSKLLLLLMAIILSADSIYSQSEKLNFYLEQKSPGMNPELFAPGIISVEGRYEYGVSFSPRLDEIYFSVETTNEGANIYFSKFKNGKWSNPEKTNLTKGEKKFEMEAFVSPDGNRIYFTAFDSMNINIWYVNRYEDTWSNAEMLDLPTGDDIVFYSNATVDRDLFFTNYTKQKIYYAPLINNRYPEAYQVNIEHGGHAYISPSQEYLLFDALKDNDRTKDRDIYVCFKINYETWSIPYLLGNNVNTDYNETCPSISPDGKYIFFSRYNESGGLSNIYWVSAKIIEELKRKN